MNWLIQSDFSNLVNICIGAHVGKYLIKVQMGDVCVLTVAY